MPDFLELRRDFLGEDVPSSAEKAHLEPMSDKQHQRMVNRLAYLMDRGKRDAITMPVDSFRGMYNDITIHD